LETGVKDVQYRAVYNVHGVNRRKLTVQKNGIDTKHLTYKNLLLRRKGI
jgi:hypothetical protein